MHALRGRGTHKKKPKKVKEKSDVLHLNEFIPFRSVAIIFFFVILRVDILFPPKWHHFFRFHLVLLSHSVARTHSLFRCCFAFSLYSEFCLTGSVVANPFIPTRIQMRSLNDNNTCFVSFVRSFGVFIRQICCFIIQHSKNLFNERLLSYSLANHIFTNTMDISISLSLNLPHDSHRTFTHMLEWIDAEYCDAIRKNTSQRTRRADFEYKLAVCWPRIRFVCQYISINVMFW